MTLDAIGEYLSKVPEKWTAEQRQNHGDALDNVLALKIEGTWTAYPKGINQIEIEYKPRAAPLIAHNIIDARERVNKSGQYSFPSFPAVIRYNLGADFENATRDGMKPQDTLMPHGTLQRDYHNEAEIISLGIHYAVSFRVDGQRPTGVVAGWTFQEHIKRIGLPIPDWAKREPRKFIKRVVGFIEGAAADNGAEIRVYGERGERLTTWDEGLMSGNDGFTQWLARTCQVVPVNLHALALVQQVTRGRKKASRAVARLENKSANRVYKGSGRAS